MGYLNIYFWKKCLKHLHMYMHLHCPHIDAFIHFLPFNSYFHLLWDVILPFIFSLDLDITFSKLSLYNPLIQSFETISVHYTLTLYLKSNRHFFFISSTHLCEFQPKKLCIVFQLTGIVFSKKSFFGELQIWLGLKQS